MHLVMSYFIEACCSLLCASPISNLSLHALTIQLVQIIDNRFSEQVTV